MNKFLLTFSMCLMILFYTLSSNADEQKKFKNENNLHLRINSDKQSYVIWEPIIITLSFINSSQSDIYIHWRKETEGLMPHWLSFELTDRDGNASLLPPIPPKPIRIEALGPEEFIKISANNSWKYKTNISKDVAGFLYSTRDKQTNTVDIRFRYKNTISGDKSNLSAWRGELSSNKIKIKVVPKKL